MFDQAVAVVTSQTKEGGLVGWLNVGGVVVSEGAKVGSGGGGDLGCQLESQVGQGAAVSQ